MVLAQAIRKNAASLAQAQTTYKENVVAVNTMIASVLTSKLPTLREFPPDWKEFTAAYEQANRVALEWVNTIMGRLLSVPQSVKSYDTIISSLLQDASKRASILIERPSDQQALQMLNNDLDNISDQLNLVTVFIKTTVDSIQQYHSKLPDMATQLQTIADRSTKDAKADQQKIAALLKDIEQLQNDIKSLTAAIVALGIAAGAAIILGTVATIVAFPVGAVVWLFVVPAVAAAGAFIVLDAAQIKVDQAKIKADQVNMDSLTADVSTLQLLAKQFAGMASQAQEIQTNLKAVLTEWQTLERDVNAAINEIKRAVSDVKGADFNRVLADISSAIQEWNATSTQAGNLYLDLQVNDATLQLDMSSDEIKAAMAKGRTIEIIRYYNLSKVA
ncbi:MAG TPA: hypothetical protein VFV38_19870 [Ktedonobacteraceae bacterium]|nr:hypothetical protein [Ktedonobacteraceae bacterium]